MGCPAESRVFNPNLGILDSKTVSCFFLGYRDKSKAYKFYCPNQYTKFIETRHIVFLENDAIRGSMTPKEIDLQERWDYVAMPMIRELVFPVHANVAPPVDTSSADIPKTSNDTRNEENRQP